jgi:methyl-accepting chemotaxis protein
VNDISTAIAAAIEEQSAATAEISRSVQQAAQSTQQVTGSIATATEVADRTDAAAGNVLRAVGELSNQAEVLRDGVERFLAAIKAA